jgi:hypothetical protein
MIRVRRGRLSRNVLHKEDRLETDICRRWCYQEYGRQSTVRKLWEGLAADISAVLHQCTFTCNLYVCLTSIVKIILNSHIFSLPLWEIRAEGEEATKGALTLCCPGQ